MRIKCSHGTFAIPPPYGCVWKKSSLQMTDDFFSSFFLFFFLKVMFQRPGATVFLPQARLKVKRKRLSHSRLTGEKLKCIFFYLFVCSFKAKMYPAVTEEFTLISFNSGFVHSRNDCFLLFTTHHRWFPSYCADYGHNLTIMPII